MSLNVVPIRRLTMKIIRLRHRQGSAGTLSSWSQSHNRAAQDGGRKTEDESSSIHRPPSSVKANQICYTPRKDVWESTMPELPPFLLTDGRPDWEALFQIYEFVQYRAFADELTRDE